MRNMDPFGPQKTGMTISFRVPRFSFNSLSLSDTWEVIIATGKWDSLCNQGCLSSKKLRQSTPSRDEGNQENNGYVPGTTSASIADRWDCSWRTEWNWNQLGVMDELDRSWNALICLVPLNPKDLFSLVFSQPAAEPTRPIKKHNGYFI